MLKCRSMLISLRCRQNQPPWFDTKGTTIRHFLWKKQLRIKNINMNNEISISYLKTCRIQLPVILYYYVVIIFNVIYISNIASSCTKVPLQVFIFEASSGSFFSSTAPLEVIIPCPQENANSSVENTEATRRLRRWPGPFFWAVATSFLNVLRFTKTSKYPSRRRTSCLLEDYKKELFISALVHCNLFI